MSGDDALRALGWRPHFARQVAPEEAGLVPLRIATVHRARMSAQSPDGPVALTLPAQVRTSDFAVGDWVLAEPETHMLVRRLERHALLQRRTEGGRGPQLIAANVDALLIVTSCNEDFNPARLERYLALANEAGTQPVIVLTKADLAPDADDYAAQARELQRGLAVVSLNAKSAQASGGARALVRTGADRGARRLLGRGQIDALQHPLRQDGRGRAGDRRHPRG